MTAAAVAGEMAETAATAASAGCRPSVSNSDCCGGSNGYGSKATAATATRNGGSNGGKR